ncbi:peroxiredoxin C [Enterobacteriaceae bacterium ET-AT1-13]|uniref:thioredoxin-dependent peroxiredoxin n=4 Tax=Cacopsylla melanoneura TaxID=428564 RepID=A0A8D8M6F8_9HEMI|nr:peroxiredoxin C [Enterobacteriaceae bacterium ET-AT1-13]WGS66440.1 peroxiredoxin C [Enterobacteriaceae bacterium Cmel17]WMC17465.1 MAG: peroxiredoxin C [Enterobacteriaceae bacterium Cmel21]WMC17672.1 MAG: peroxiredoxin C [Enterobacteriaceae bacterium PSmelAO3-2]WMC17876.1 MAG: peroxiredoxin C [Enterobacteriaceae bacterium PSmelAO3-1]WMC18080.1 MAG: peroxiredoxin C [Enterobacteriaceae bacterium PSmelAO1]
MTLVTCKAPDFTASAVLSNGKIIKNFNFKNYINNKYILLFFWPMDFTFVCPSELIAFNKRFYEFQKRNVELIGVSFDSEYVHKAWRNTPINKGGISKVKYIMIADVKREIQKSYGIEHPEFGFALRASFLIDKNRIIRTQIVNDLPIGRNVDEIIRTIDALQFHEKYGDVCPAQWIKGKPSIVPSTNGVIKYLNEHLDKL